MLSRRPAAKRSSASTARVRSVSTNVGATALTRMPNSAHWAASERVMESTAPLLAEYSVWPNLAPYRPRTDERLMMEPPPR